VLGEYGAGKSHFFELAAQEALAPSFKEYAQAIVDNAKVLGQALAARGFSLVTGGTDNHLLLVDLTNKTVPGKVASKALDRANIVLNYNAVPFDPRKPFDPSGIRLGTPSVTSRNMGKDVMVKIAEWMDRVVAAPTNEDLIGKVAAEVRELCQSYPAPGLRV